MKCPVCQEDTSGPNFCGYCGKQIITCPTCGKKHDVVTITAGICQDKLDEANIAFRKFRKNDKNIFIMLCKYGLLIVMFLGTITGFSFAFSMLPYYGLLPFSDGWRAGCFFVAIFIPYFLFSIEYEFFIEPRLEFKKDIAMERLRKEFLIAHPKYKEILEHEEKEERS